MPKLNSNLIRNSIVNIRKNNDPEDIKSFVHNICINRETSPK